MSLPGWLLVLGLAMAPVSELRGAIPVGVALKMPLWEVVALAMAGNLAAGYALFFGLRLADSTLARLPLIQQVYAWWIARVRAKAAEHPHLSTWGLTLFIAIPLPMTGAWTGAGVAWVLGLPPRSGIIGVTLGVLGAAAIVTTLTLAGVWAVGR